MTQDEWEELADIEAETARMTPEALDVQRAPSTWPPADWKPWESNTVTVTSELPGVLSWNETKEN